MNLRKGFRITTWVISLAAFVGCAVGGIYDIVMDGYEYFVMFAMAFVSFAGIWLIYWLIYWLIINRQKWLPKTRSILLTVGVILVVWFCIHPPWQTILRDGNVKIIQPRDSSYIWEPPSTGYRRSSRIGITVDYGRLGLQVGVVLFVMGMLILPDILPSKKKD